MRQRISKGAKLAALVALFLGHPSVAQANAGVPMIFIVAPILGWAIVPIIVAEGAALKFLLALENKRAYLASALGNALSTLVGIPLTWGLLVGLQLLSGGDGAHGIATPLQKIGAVTWQGAWLIPYEDHLFWMIPAACLFLTVPFFLVSLWSERIVCTRLLKGHDRDAVCRAVLYANTLTYAVLGFASFLWLGWSVRAV